MLVLQLGNVSATQPQWNPCDRIAARRCHVAASVRQTRSTLYQNRAWLIPSSALLSHGAVDETTVLSRLSSPHITALMDAGACSIQIDMFGATQPGLTESDSEPETTKETGRATEAEVLETEARRVRTDVLWRAQRPPYLRWHERDRS
eukprot:COSAG03_NODE_1759_length_3565_cov_6.498557_3_plen_148_part_00